MTKLTKEQIGQERVKFEGWARKKNLDIEIKKLNGWGELSYLPFIDAMFDGWLARAELDKPKSYKFLPLTDKQLNVLSYIEQYINERGYSPKLKEVQNALNFKSESSINAILKHLINKGYLIKNTGWRGLELAKEGE